MSALNCVHYTYIYIYFFFWRVTFDVSFIFSSAWDFCEKGIVMFAAAARGIGAVGLARVAAASVSRGAAAVCAPAASMGVSGVGAAQTRSIGSVRVKNAAKWEAIRAGGTLQRSVQNEGLVKEVRSRARYEKPAVTRRRIKKNKKRKERQRKLYALFKRFEARKDAKVKNQMYKEGVL